MSNGPSAGGAYCPWCGGALMWAAEQGQWFCVRDQQWIHPQQLYSQAPQSAPQPQQGYPDPQLGYAPRPGAPAPGYTAPRSRKGLFIGLGLVGVVGLGVALFLLLGGSDGGRGAGSAAGLARAAMKAIEKQDPKALMRLGPSVQMIESVSNCPDDSPKRDELEAELRWMRKIRRTAKKGLAVKGVTESEEFTHDPGDKIRGGNDCTAKRKFSLHAIKLKLESDDDARAKMYAMKLDGRWYLTGLSGLPDRDLSTEEREEERVLERKARKKAREALRKKAKPLPESVGASSATEAAEELFKAINRGDLEKLRKLLPEKSTIDLGFDCDPDAKLMRDVELSRSRLKGNPGKSGDIKVVRGDLVMSTKLEPGKEVEGCTAAADGTVGEVKLTLNMSGTDINFIIEVVQIQGRWFILSTTPRPT